MLVNNIKRENLESLKKTELDFDMMNTHEEIKSIIHGIENSYGGVEGIMCQRIDNGEMIETKRFKTLEEFDANFSNEDFELSTIFLVEIPSLSKRFIIDKPNRKMVILTNDELKNTIFKYYLVNDEHVFKRDESTENFYKLEKETGEWNRVPSMIGLMNDGTYNFVEITEDDANNYLSGKIK